MNDDRHTSMRVKSDFTDHIEEKKKKKKTQSINKNQVSFID